jgi:ABC-2 type transport system ATP-binding protein
VRASLEALGLRKRFGPVQAVGGVDLVIPRGERVGLLGPNGAGKTTTLLMVLGAIDPDEGHVTIAGHPLARQREAALGSVGFAAGYLPLPDRLTVTEALRTFAGFYGVPDEKAAVTETLSIWGIEHLADRRCERLSSGQRTLAGIAKSWIHRPELLVLDEPTASLDPEVAYRVRQRLLRICAEHGTSLLITSHDMREVALLCERVIFLARGNVVANASPADIATQFGEDDLEGVFLQLAGQSLHEEEEL